MKIKDFIDYEQPTDYIVESDRYSDEYETPVLTAGQSFVLGYTNEKEGIYNKNSCIIFDDFTTSVHYVDFPFKVKSSAMKILTSKRNADLKYCYYLLLSLSKMPPNHKRQWISTTSEKDHSLPSTENQVTIVKQLDLISKTITWYKKQIENLDVLVRSRFVEMFGDPVLNPLGWDVKPVIDICDCMVPGRDKPKSFTGSIPWITIDDLVVNSTTYRSKQGLGLTEEEISEVKRKKIPAGSVVMSCVGNLGICSIAGNEMIINQQLHSFQCNSEIDNVFLMYYLGQRKDYMEKQASSTTVLYMNKSVCNSIPVMIPDLVLQKQFASFVNQIDKSKSAIQASLDKTQLLFDSLMQEYFG